MEETERFKKVVDYLIYKRKITTQRDLADKLGYTESSLSQIINGKVSASSFIKKLAKFDENINQNWLMTGEGAMLLNVEDKVGFTDEFEMKEVFKESQNEYNSKKGDVVLSREVFEQISRLTETVLSQQRTIELMQREKVKRDARMEEDATCADVAGSDIRR